MQQEKSKSAQSWSQRPDTKNSTKNEIINNIKPQLGRLIVFKVS